MERYPLSHEDDDDDSESGPSKKKARAAISTLGGLTAEKIIQKDENQKEKKPETEPSLWQRLTAPEEEPGRKSGSGVDQKAEAGSDTVEAAEAPMEKLSPAEAQEVVRQYAEAESADIQAELDARAGEETAQAEAAADMALLASIREKLAENPDRPVEEVLDEAEAETVGKIREAAPDEAEPVAEATIAPEGEIPLRPEDTAADTTETAIPVRGTASAVPSAPAGSSGAGGGRVPPAGPSFGAAGAMPPVGSASGPSAGAARSGMRFNTAAAPVMTPELAMEAERRILARGVLVGGIVGYLIGRRRGRIKTEKRLIPVQKKLEKQVKTLTEAVAIKEQTVRKLAAERTMTARSSAERQRVIDTLRAAPAEQRTSESRTGQGRIHPRAERLGRVVVEAPAVVRGDNPSSAETGREAAGAIINFNRKVEDYTTRELVAAAEKIRIDGTTLKELYATHRLDEKALRRVVRAFIEGRSVREALSHELLEKELRYERDPKMRAARKAAGASSGPASVAAVAGLAIISHEAEMPQTSSGNQTAARQPVPDQQTLDRIRRQQITQVTLVSTLLLIFLLVVLVALIR